MSSLKEFQDHHGRQWGELIGQPAFGAALALAHKERLEKISLLTDSEINENGKIILADLRGHLQYEGVLLGLHEKKEYVFQQLPPEEYPDPTREMEEEKSFRAPISESGPVAAPTSIHEILPTTAPKKKRGRPPMRKGKKK